MVGRDSALSQMPGVNTCVRRHGSTDRHDEWLGLPTRRDAPTGSQRCVVTHTHTHSPNSLTPHPHPIATQNPIQGAR